LQGLDFKVELMWMRCKPLEKAFQLQTPEKFRVSSRLKVSMCTIVLHQMIWSSNMIHSMFKSTFWTAMSPSISHDMMIPLCQKLLGSELF
jgi:hypothetical protein